MMATSLIQSKSYWDNRAKAEKAWQELVKKDVDKYNQHIVELYNNAISDINKQIKSDIAFSGGNLVKAEDMKEYETLAKRAVAKANALRAKGKHVTRKDFSADVDNRLKVYNATMRINRNEILKSKIGARLVELGVEQETDLTKKLWNDYIKEKERQAGILGITTKSDLWTSKEVQGQIYKQIANANFSKRIWADIDGLKGTLDGLVSTAIIRGDNPKSMAKWLTGMVSATVGNQRYAAERLARTETARVQFEAQQKSILDAGYKYVKWMAEGSACKFCREIAYKDNGYDEDGVYKAKDVPDIPVHPNCMCSISAYWVEKKPKDDVENLNSDSKETITEDHGYKVGKPMTIEEADNSNANPNYSTPKLVSIRKQLSELRPKKEELEDNIEDLEFNDETSSNKYKKLKAEYQTFISKYRSLQRDLGNENNKVKLYRANCQRCVPTYELRRRGYKVTALPKPINKSHFEIYGKPTNFFIDKDKNVIEFEYCKVKSGKDLDTFLKKNMPVDTRNQLSFGWDGQKIGHTIVVEKEKNDLLYVDPQSGKKVNSFRDFTADYAVNWKKMRTRRIDNADINTDYLKDIVKNEIR